MSKGFFRRPGLLVPAALAPAAETAILAVVGPTGGAALAPQVTAPPPLDLFHDLRWVAVYHNSWFTLAAELVAVLLLRSLWVAWVVQRSWPDRTVPPMTAAIRRVAVYYAIAGVLFAPWVVLLFGLALSHLSFLFFAALPPALALAAIIHRGAASHAAGQWWWWRPSWRGILWILAAFVWLTAAGAVVTSASLPVAVLVSALAGLANARAWYGMVQAVALPRRGRPRLVLTPALVAGTLAVAIGGSSAGLSVTLTRGPSEARDGALPEVAAAAVGGGRPVLIAAGLYSRFDASPPVFLPDGYVGWRFSYRGVDAAGRPLPYEPEDTQQSILTSARLMAEQVSVLAEAYRQPVAIIAESHGALVARSYLVHLYPPDARTVDRLITLDLVSGVSDVYFPPRGEQGWGVATGWGLRGLAEVLEGIGGIGVSVDSPLARELVECRSFFERSVTAPLPPGVEEFTFQALADQVDPQRARPGTRPYVVTAAHGGLVERQGVQRLIRAVLGGDETMFSPPPAAGTLAELVSATSRPWQVPDLAPELTPAMACSR